MASAPSLKSVAAAAGVSVSSVSNAYNKPEQLSTEVRERILQVARDQGYAGPDAAARSLRSKRAGAIGVLLTEQLSYAFSDPYTVGLLAGIARVAEQFRTGLLLIPVVPGDRANAEDVEASVLAVRQAVVDGIVAYCIDADHPARAVIRSRGLPEVSTNDVPGATHKVLIDEAGAMTQLGAHLRDLGHRNVGAILMGFGTQSSPVVDEPETLEMSDLARKRLAGLRAGLGEGVRLCGVGSVSNSVESGRAAAAALLDRADRPSAIVATSDVMALGALDALAQRGLVPGRDVSVSGFDDVPEAAEAGLTTVRQPIAERGLALGRMLLDPDYTETQVVLPTELIVRASTGPAPDPTRSRGRSSS